MWRTVFSVFYGLVSAVMMLLMFFAANAEDWDRAMVYGFAAVVLAIWENSSEVRRAGEDARR